MTYAVLRQHGYVILSCDREGVAIHHHGDEAKASEFKHWGWSEAIVHSRPWISTLGQLPVDELLSPSRGGLPPVVTQRMCEYIESHLDQKITLQALAAIAGLSTRHFARAFNQSMGTPPHGYLLSWRLERAERMLRETQVPLSEIAAATGFSDQSHLARHFRRRTGMSPRLARWKER